MAPEDPFPRGPTGGALPFGAVDLNADLGEGFGVWLLGDDEALLDTITSANLACGFHAGDPRTMRRMCIAAASSGVTIGAQVAYRDLAGFGRRRIEYEPDELRDDVLYQIAALDGFARVAGTRVKYVKPHGALYRTTTDDEEQTAAVVAAIVEYDLTLAVLGLPGSALLRLAERVGLRTVAEGYPHRGYLPSGELARRKVPGALITEADEILKRAIHLAAYGEVVAVDGTVIEAGVDSLCLPAEAPGAATLAHAIRSGLAEVGVAVAPFTR